MTSRPSGVGIWVVPLLIASTVAPVAPRRFSSARLLPTAMLRGNDAYRDRLAESRQNRVDVFEELRFVGDLPRSSHLAGHYGAMICGASPGVSLQVGRRFSREDEKQA